MAFQSVRLNSHILVVDSVTSRRQMLSDIVRSMGFQNVDLLKDGQELSACLEKSSPDWIVMTILDADAQNVLATLSEIVATPKLRGTRVSLILSDEAESFVLPTAFELGLMSYHSCGNVRERLEQSLVSLIGRLDLHAWNTTLVAAEYLREYLAGQGLDKPLLRVLSSLVELYPGSGRLLLQMAESQAALGAADAAERLLSQALLISPRLEPQVVEIRAKVAAVEAEDAEGALKAAAAEPARKMNVLGIDTCVVIDSDTAVQHGVTQMLKEAGVASVLCFQDGEAAIHWLSSNAEPGLIIMEWRIPKVSGPMMIQRVRQHGHVGVPIIVASSLVGDEDQPILKEMGASAMLMKPFDQESFFATIVSTVQQHRSPSEYASYENKIRAALAHENLAEARRLYEQCLSDTRISSADRCVLEADMAYCAGSFEEARDFALESLREQGDRLYTLNLLGKTFLKLSRPDLALRCFEQAQELSPLNVRRLCDIATIHAEAGEIARADESLDKARALDPGNPVVSDTECRVALSSGDDARISESLASVDSIGRLLVYLNNRAVALSRVGQFHEGINLFRRTVRALPGEWSGKHDAVTYNLGLTLARFGEFGEAICQLRLVQGIDGERVRRKAESLVRRIEAADRDGTQLIFRTAEVKAKAQAPANDPADSALEVRRGDLCCHRIFRALELASPRALAMLGIEKPAAKRAPDEEVVCSVA